MKCKLFLKLSIVLVDYILRWFFNIIFVCFMTLSVLTYTVCDCTLKSSAIPGWF